MTNNNATKPIPITLNCSGGISLGAYMAGVFYELTKEAVQDNPAILIDIITGASAGAMSGTMAAFHLLNEHPQDQLNDFKQTAFYQAWVEKADIKNIDRFEFPWKIFSSQPPQALSILSGNYLKSIADDVLKPDQIKITPDTQPLALIMTVTNLQGLLKKTKLCNLNKTIKSVTSAETRKFLFHPGLDQNTVIKSWNKAIISGRASGAFPVAFPPLQDDSHQGSVNLNNIVDEYLNRNGKLLDQNNIRTGQPKNYHFNFTYTDGGVLDGLPIIKGIQLIKDLNSSNITQDLQDFKKYWETYCKKSNTNCESDKDRRYLYIQPQPVEQISHRKSLTQAHFPMHHVGWKGLTLPKAEHDMLRLNQIEQINDLVKIKEDFLQQYSHYLPQKALDHLNQAMPYATVNLNRIDPTIIRELEQTPNSDLAEIYSALVNKSELGKKVSQASSEELLASEFFGAFGGFFDQRYREHDFLLGRISGLTWLHHHCQNITTPIPTQELIKEIETKILDEEPKLKPSHWLRIFRIVPRLLRIYLTEVQVKHPWRILLLLLKGVFIPLLALLELLITPIITVIQAMNV